MPARIPPTLVDNPSAVWYFTVPAIFVAVLTVLLLGYGLRERESVLANGAETSRQIANHTALIAEGTIDATHQLLGAMGFLVDSSAPPTRQQAASIRERLLALRDRNPHLMDLLILSPRGEIEHWTGATAVPDIRDRDYFAHHIAKPDSDLFIGAPLQSKVHAGKWFFGMSQAVRSRDGALSHIVVALIDVSLFSAKLAQIDTTPARSQVLLTKEGMVYARVPRHDDFVGKTIDRPTEMGLLSSTNPRMTMRQVSNLDKRERIISLQQLHAYPLVAAGTLTVESLLAQWRQQMLLVVLFWSMLSAAIIGIGRQAYSINRKLNQQASIDSLTGIQNRRSILAVASGLERSQANAGSLSLLMIDVDHFKLINDSFGHQVGDTVLTRISDILRTEIRQTDIVGRFGGEEFLVLMPNTGPEGALLVAEKLCKAVAAAISDPASVTISIGIATSAADDATLDKTMSRADAALYQAKAAGRNCVRAA